MNKDTEQMLRGIIEDCKNNANDELVLINEAEEMMNFLTGSGIAKNSKQYRNRMNMEQFNVIYHYGRKDCFLDISTGLKNLLEQ